jgi:uncharacterized oligopeptide transporter (OPT) family protein
MDEDTWRRDVFRGDARQLTLRALVMGSALGFVLSLTNVYVGLKTGWFLHVAIVAAVLSVGGWSLLVRLRIARSRMSILENNCAQSVASSAGYATGNTLVSAVPALLLATGHAISVWLLLPWIFSLAVLGVMMAAPLRRRLIVVDRLRFPTGTAAAVVLQTLYENGKGASARARALVIAAVVSALGPLLFDLRALRSPSGRRPLIDAPLRVFDPWLKLSAPQLDVARRTVQARSIEASGWNVRLDHSLLLVAAGAIVGPRVAFSMLLGSALLVLYIGPEALGALWTTPAGDLVSAAASPASAFATIGLWFGAPLIVAHGVALLALEWRAIGRALGDLRGARSLPRTAHDEDVPFRWIVVGGAIAGAAVVTLAWLGFGIAPYLGALAVALTFVLALVTCRVAGEADVAPIGPVGKVTQLSFGVVAPQRLALNLMTASITAGASLAAADLLTDLKAGHLLGASPRRQIVAQLVGTVSGAVAACLAYTILVPDASVFSTSSSGVAPLFAAPAARQWEAVARVLALGLDHLHPMARGGIFVGGALGILLATLETAMPRTRHLLPSATGLGLGLMLPFYQSLAMAIGAVASAVFRRVRPEKAQAFTLPIASGLVVGESLLGVVVQATNQLFLR